MGGILNLENTNGITLAEMAEGYARTVGALTLQIDALLAQRSGMQGTALHQLNVTIETLRGMRRESRGMAALLLHYYD